MYEYPVIAVDALILQDDKVLVIKRKTKTFKGFYALPGGKLENKELLRDAIIREVKEETNLDVMPYAMLGIYDEVDRDPRGRVVSVVYLCKPLKPIIENDLNENNREVSEIKLIPIKDIVEDKVKLAFDHNKIVKNYYNLLKLGKK